MCQLIVIFVVDNFLKFADWVHSCQNETAMIEAETHLGRHGVVWAVQHPAGLAGGWHPDQGHALHLGGGGGDHPVGDVQVPPHTHDVAANVRQIRHPRTH